MKYENILVVDDSVTARLIIKKCFDITGFSSSKYYFAENGLDALNIIKDNNIDLIITDMNMPKMDGSNFIKEMKSKDNKKSIPIVVISGITNPEVEEELINMGIYGIIRKPISPAKIIELLGD
ncbi:MAG: response regulator [Spirochaetes bacterium]|nr:response regulator [Spirochaetota bacterium]